MKQGGTLKRTPFKRKTALKRGTVRLKRGKKKGRSPSSMWELYGIKKPAYVRYSGRKGIYWYLFSLYVRQRDFNKYGGECIDQCGKRASHWREFQAGHFVPAHNCGFGLLFDETNVNAQLPACNNPRISPMASIGYARGLDLRYGQGVADTLILRRQETTKEWSQVEYDYRIRSLLSEGVYQARLDQLV